MCSSNDKNITFRFLLFRQQTHSSAFHVLLTPDIAVYGYVYFFTDARVASLATQSVVKKSKDSLFAHTDVTCSYVNCFLLCNIIFLL